MSSPACTNCGSTSSVRRWFDDDPEGTSVCADFRACQKRMRRSGGPRISGPQGGQKRLWSNDDPVLRPYPLQPLLDLVGDHPTAKLRVSGSRMAMLARHGWLTGLEADTLACRIGLHPSEVWPVMWAAEDDVEATFLGIRERLAS